MTIPDYTLRYSKKAKHLQLKLSSLGLEVVIPEKKNISTQVIEKFIQQKKLWIAKNQQFFSNARETAALPSVIHLPAIQQTWEVKYLGSMHHTVKLMVNACGIVTLMGNIENSDVCLSLLKKWLKKIAKNWLPNQLMAISQETGLGFSRVCIRDNVTRWGSCSSKKSISLCCKILFLPPHLARHVLLHELCHTKVMNHSGAFWRLLTSYDPNAAQHAQELRYMSYQLPGWIRSV